MKLASLLIALSFAVAVPAAAQDADDILSKIINTPVPDAVRVDGTTGKIRKDASVQGGKALRIDVPGKGANPWDVGIASPLKKPVKAGDQLVLAFWAKLTKGENGATTATLPFNAIQLGSAPYTPLFNQPLTIGTQWKLYEVQGKSDKDYPADTLNASIHLATAKQTIDIGPVFVLNLSQ